MPAPPRNYAYPRLSPDGTRLALYIADQEVDIWLWDLARATLTRVTFDPGIDIYPVWTPDGRQLLFSSDAGGRAESLRASRRRHRRRHAADRESQLAGRHLRLARWHAARVHGNARRRRVGTSCSSGWTARMR